MGREHVEFAITGEIKWESVKIPGFSNDVEQKLLSVNKETGAFTSQLYLPAGTKSMGGVYTTAIECLILTGDLKVGENKLSEITHFYLDSNTTLEPFTTENGCLMLFMSDAKLELQKTGNKSSGEIKITNAHEIPWEGTITPGFPTGAMRKSLFNDPVTGASSWLLGVLPHFKDSRYEIHPVMEEGYQIQGELNTDRGNFKAGYYFWRPPEIPHGNFQTDYGCLTFFRTDGPLQTTYVTAEDLIK